LQVPAGNGANQTPPKERAAKMCTIDPAIFSTQQLYHDLRLIQRCASAQLLGLQARLKRAHALFYDHPH